MRLGIFRRTRRYPLASMRTDPSFEPLLTQRLRIRRSVPADAEAISAYRSDPSVHVHQGWPDTGVDQVRADIEAMAAMDPGSSGWFQFSLDDLASGHLVGDSGLSPADDEPGVIKVGYTIDPAWQGRGFATEAVAALVDYAFAVLEVNLVRAYADLDNVASTRVMEKVGMRLMETFEGEEDGEKWVGVRYERHR